MHETAIAHNIIQAAKRHGKVKAIYLEVGELAHVPAEDLVKTLRSYVSWKINSKVIKAKTKCSCGFVGSPRILEREHDFFLIDCPKCRVIPEIIEGKDIKLTKVVVK